ncbi:MAG: hypothetical protein RR550_03165, partial [Rikenellaceae bacterium]
MEKKFEGRSSNTSFFKKDRGTDSSREERGSRDDFKPRREDSGERGERRSFNPNFSADNRVRGGQRRDDDRREGGFQRREGVFQKREGGSFERRDNNRDGGFQRREGG